MAQSGFTPIVLYHSDTTTNVPTTIVSGELAANTADGKLFLGTGTNTYKTLLNVGSSTITISGNLTHAGAFTQSFTATGNTAVTLPVGNTASANNLLSSATAVAIVTGTPSSTTYLRGDGTWASISLTSGTVTTVSVVSANGFAGTVANATTTPAITLTTSITGLLQGNGTAISAVTVGAGLSFSGGTLSTSGGGGTVSTGNVVLTSSSTSAQSIATTSYGQTVTLPDATTLSANGNLYNINNTGGYPLTILNNTGSILGFAFPYSAVIVGLASNSTAAGTWNLSGHELLAVTAETNLIANVSNIYQVITLDSTRTLVILGFSTNTYGIIWDSSSQTFGTLTVISSTYGGSTSNSILTTTNQVLLCQSDGSTTLATVVLTLSGTTITVGTYVTATVTSINNNQAGMIIAQGSSWVYQYGGTSQLYIVAITISGTTPTIGTPTALSGTTVAYGNISSISATVLLSVSYTSATTIYATPYTVSGTTITAGTGATVATAATLGFRILPISTTRRVIAYLATGGTTIAGTIITVTTTVATMSTVTLATSNAGGIGFNDMIVSGSKLIFHQCGVGFQILTDTAGTASVGTFLSSTLGATTGITTALSATNNIATFAINSSNGNTNLIKININFSTASPTLTLSDVLYNSSATSYQVAWTNIATGMSGTRPINSLFGTINIFLDSRSVKYGFVNQSATLAYTTKFTTVAGFGANVSFIGANNELWTASTAGTPSLLRVQSIT